MVIHVENFVHCPSSEAKQGRGFKVVYFKHIHCDMFSHFSISCEDKGMSSPWNFVPGREAEKMDTVHNLSCDVDIIHRLIRREMCTC